MRTFATISALLVTVLCAVSFGSEKALATSCSAFDNQAAAQRAHNTRDADHDGIYCESLPCPCLGKGGGGGTKPPSHQPASRSCVLPRSVVTLWFSRSKYPNIRRHTIRAIKRGWPSVLVINRAGASRRRSKLLAGYRTLAGNDRDEYPPAMARGRGRGLTRGTSPTGWMADVMYVPSSENRSHGSSMGSKLRRYCNGTRFRYRFN